MIGGRQWTAGRLDRPPHGRYRTTNHSHQLKTGGGGRRTKIDYPDIKFVRN